MKNSAKLSWWQKEIIYQIYPRSFMDSNDDGIGDLKGIISKLDYLRWLGIGIVWISPVFPSPMADFGYDVSDYTAIHPMFGSMSDMEDLIIAAHEREMKIVLDLVPNHTSIDHQWFRESRSSRENPRRDWYIWKDPAKDGGPPNNWLSEFGGSAWSYDEKTGQYYCHSFLKEQPDLNWHNPEVREAMWEVMRFWLDKNVDGFRVDVLWYLIKDKLFRDNPPNPDWHEGMPEHDKLIAAYSNDQPEVHDVVEEMRQVADAYEDRLIIGEIYLPVSKLVAYYGKRKGSGVHLPFNFHLVLSAWDAEEIYKLIALYEGALPEGGWPNWVLGNHDKARIKARAGEAQVHNAAILLLTLRGTPTMYYGDEIGMDNVEIPPDRLKDPREFIEPGIGVGRDPQRTPMQWSAGENAGFSNTRPWLPTARDVSEINVEKEKSDRSSLLNFYRRLIQLRQEEPALYSGSYHPAGIHKQLMCYTRRYSNTEYLIALNMGDETLSYATDFEWKGKVVIAKNESAEGEFLENHLSLKGGEGLVIKLL